MHFVRLFLLTTFLQSVIDCSELLQTISNNSLTMADSFKEDFSFMVNDYIKVSKYKSLKSGLSVVVAEVPGPVVNGYLCLSTEAHDDDGLPHTLEHLVFMGSEEYPFKGVLDLLANRCLASGTNAWTDTDNTCYTMTTAGSEGFLNLLPIYLDHVIYPTLIPSAYVTEVHHVNGEGEDAGVVYCEMQARENTGESLTHLELLREMYPGHCGYKSETGGILKNLRESTSHQKVMDYHKDYYRPDNLSVIIVGQVSPEAVFEALEPFEKKIIDKGPLKPFERPWMGKVPSLPNSVEKVVKYGADDEEHGMVNVAWRGPKSTDLYEMTAIGILMEYLCDTAISPLQKEFVEKLPPLANDVSYSIIENNEGVVYIHFSNVPTEKQETVKPKLMEILTEVCSDKEDAFDLVRMRNEVHRKITKTLNAFEDDPHEHIAGVIIGFFLYGNNSEELDKRLNDVELMKRLQLEPASFWKKLIADFMLTKNSVTIMGKPSKALMEEMGQKEKDRVEAQRKALGEEGLKVKKEEVEAAIDLNEEEPPTEMLESVPIPGVDSIHFHSLVQIRNFGDASGAQMKEFDVGAIPFPFQVDHVKSSFVELTTMMDTHGLSPNLKFYLPLYLNLIFETNLTRDGGKTIVPHTTVISELTRDTVYYGGSLGFDGSDFDPGEFGDLAIISLKVEELKFSVGVKWLKDIMFNVHFTEERIKTVATKLVNEVPALKRKGTTVLRALTRNLNFNQKSNHWSSSLMRQHSFLNQVLSKIEAGQGEAVIGDLLQIKTSLASSDSLIVHMAGDIQRLAKIVSLEDLPLTKEFQSDWPLHVSVNGVQQCQAKNGVQPQCLSPPTVKASATYLKPMKVSTAGDSPELSHVIIGVGSVESSFLTASVPSIDHHNHQDLAPLMVLIQYLTQLEGPMWRQIRGLGLSYHYSMYVNIEHGLLYFTLQKSTHLANAFKEAKKITESFISGDEDIDETEFEAAKSSLVFEIIEDEKTVSAAATQSLLSFFRATSNSYRKELLRLVSEASIPDLLRVGKSLLLPIFDAKQTRTSVVCHPTKVEALQKEFREMNVHFHALPTLEHDLLADTNLSGCHCN